jgi:hypothetical protein
MVAICTRTCPGQTGTVPGIGAASRFEVTPCVPGAVPVASVAWLTYVTGREDSVADGVQRQQHDPWGRVSHP